MNTNRKLLGCSLIAAVILSLLPYPSLATKSPQPVAAPQEKGVLVSELVQNPTPNDELSKHFRKYDLVRMDPSAASSQLQKTGRLVLKSSVRDFDLHMSRHDLRSADYTAQVIDSNGVAQPLPRGEVHTYKGYVKGLPEAQARMSLTQRGLEGAIITKQARYFLQPARSISKQSRVDEYVLYESGDHTTDEHGTCGVTLADEIAAQEQAAKAGAEVIEAEASGPVSSFTPMKRARIATDADAEYVAFFGGPTQANQQITSILNFVDGIYQSETGITFEIVQQNTWTNAATDPYTSTAASTRLQQFRDHWNVNFVSGGPNAPTRALAHLFTGVNLDGGTIGIASLGVACRSAQFSYGLSQQFFFGQPGIFAETVVLTAHEIGHNFGATHTNQESPDTPADIEQPCQGTIMEAFVGAGSSFCPFSRSQIAGQAVGHSSCLIDLVTPPPTSQDCPTTPLAGNSANGTLGPGDCRSPSRGVEHFADRYSFNGIAGQRISISMNATGGGLTDTYLYLIGPDGYFVSQNDDASASTFNSRIPFNTGTIALPQTGVYIVEATSFDRLATGNYTVTVTPSGCTLSASPVPHFSSAGGAFNVQVTANGTCGELYQVLTFPDSANWISPQLTGGTGSTQFSFTVAPNSQTAGRRAFLVFGPSQDDGTGGLRIPITQSGTGPDCASTPIGFNQTLNGTLTPSDCHSPVRGSGFVADRYTFNASSGQKVAISTSAAVGAPDTFLTLVGPNGVVLITDDDSGGQTNSRIPGGNRSLTLGLPGTYTIEVTQFTLGGTLGSYSLTLNADSSPANTIALALPSQSVGEATPSLTVTVNRTGDTSASATVDYATNDTAGSNSCNTITGAASSRCDYLRTLGTLRFAAGETSKQITIPIINDVYAEGSETFTLNLSNPIGATLGTATSTLTITDNDATNGVNPIDDPTFFVRQHYIDFLNREPDTAGLNFWVNEITSCGSNTTCIEVKRINVSAAFFLSIEFQETGYLVYRTYKSAFGNLPGAPVPVVLTDFLRDTQQIGQGVQVNVGEWQAQLEANKQAYMQAFVQRADFLAAFPNSMTATDFVTQLNNRAGGVLSASEQTNLINLLGPTPSDVTKRSQVLRAVAEDVDLRNAEFNRAFVLMQYFGYLRRNPNEFPDSNFSGFDFWLDKLNDFNGNFITAEMVKAFISSLEYRQRFGP